MNVLGKNFLKTVLIAAALSCLAVRGAGAAEAAGGAETGAPHILTPYQTSNFSVWDNDERESFSMMGTAYYQGLTQENYNSERQALYNLEGGFTSVTMEVGHLDGERTGGATLYLYMDGALTQTLELTSDMITKKLELDVTGVRQLRLDQEGSDAAYGYANVTGYGGHIFTMEMTQVPSVYSSGIYTYSCRDCGYSYAELVEEQEECVPYLQPYQTENLYSIETTEDPLDCFYVMGKAYYYGVIPSNYNSAREALYNLGQQYSSVTFTVGHMDNERTGGGVLQVFGDGNLMKEIQLTSDMLSQEVTINTEGVTQLKLSYNASDSNYPIFDMRYEAKTVRQHEFTSEVILEATASTTGICTYTCVNCGATYNEVIPALGN